MMVTCESCREQMLDYLYGLLDPSELSAFATHIASCPTCTAAHAESAAVQGLITQASIGSFPEVKFIPPNDLVSSQQARSVWSRYAPYALAAAILLAVTAIALDNLPGPAPLSGTGIAQITPSKPSIRLPDGVRFTAPLRPGREGVDAGVIVSLSSDKTDYQPGDALFFRSLTLDGKTMKPLLVGNEPQLRFELRSDDGTKTIVKSNEIVGIETPLLDADAKEFETGLKFGSITLPSMLPHGVYLLSAFDSPNATKPISTLKVNVGQPKTQSLAMVIVFDKPTYREGDAVSAKVTVTKAGKPYGNKQFQVEATHADNQELATVTPMIGSLDATGAVTISLSLPKAVQLRSPTIKVTILDQNNESITQAIPLAK